MHNTQLLPWDTEMLGVRVAKILSTHLHVEELKQSLQQLKAQGIELVYWVFDSPELASKEAAIACGGFFVDEKITYSLDLITLPPLPFPYPEIGIYMDSVANSELIALAMEIVPFSRFSRDPHLSAQQVNRLYTAWIGNACKKLVAKIILVARAHNILGTVSGMVSIDDKQGRADLSLLAVAPLYRHRGIGKRLVYAAHAWCIAHDYSMSQVVTQQTNPRARHLYESCGYQQEKIEYFYHFWL